MFIVKEQAIRHNPAYEEGMFNLNNSIIILLNIVHMLEMKGRLELESNPSYSIVKTKRTCTDYENIVMWLTVIILWD